jgi:PAS domain S-box-containing protein
VDRAALNDFFDEVFAHALPASCEVLLGNDVALARTVALDGVRSVDGMECRLSMTDVTDRRRAESALRLRDRAMRAVTQGIIITDPHQPGNPIVYANPGFEAMTGYTAVEVAGRNCRFLQGRETDQSAVRTLREAVEGERPVSVELLNYRKDGTPFWNALFVTPVRDDQGALLQFIGVQIDVTAQRETERALRQSQRLETVGRLAGGVAHDFNNLLTVVLGSAGLLQAELEASDPRSELVSSISNAAERAASLTAQLLAFSRSQMLDPNVLDIGAALHSLDGTLRRLVGSGIAIEISTPSVPLYSRVDLAQFGQVLVNLVRNARDAISESGRVTISIEESVLAAAERIGHEEVPAGRYALLTVHDTGIGMNATTASHAFEPFYSTKGVGKGSGLGLAMVYGFVKQSAGFVAIESAPGMGSSILVYLPAVAAPVAAATATSASPLGGETILLAEEDADVRRFVHSVLAQQGYRLILCESARSTLESVAAHAGAIDLMIVTQSPAGMEALELIARVRALRPHLRTLLMTDDATIVTDGSDTITRLAKPLNAVVLTRSVRAILDAAQEK